MDAERIKRALERIEAAADRINVAAQTAPAPASDPELAQRHEKLREEAGAALAQLDDLIETLEQ